MTVLLYFATIGGGDRYTMVCELLERFIYHNVTVRHEMACNHMMVALAITAVALLIFLGRSEGFRSQEEKSAIAARMTTVPVQKPEFEAMKSIGLDGAEYYSVRQLWNNRKFTKDNIAKVL